MNRIILQTLLALLLSGCRITTTVVGEGTVTSQSGNFNCSTGNTGDCTQEYATAGSETFVAVPAPGWTFAKWANCNYAGILSCNTSFGQNTANDVWPVTATFKRINPPVQAATYTYNALGQRMTKKVGTVATLFQYDLEGNLIAELNSSGQALRQHIHINNQPIAQLSRKADGTIDVQYVHTDHLGTPTLLTNQSGKVVADIEAMPFGETYVDYAEVEYNKRFPGQYKDAETGLHYNYFRDYDPSIGRYIQSDPIGLGGGLNIYAYVASNPLIYIDSLGLDKTLWINIAGGRNISDGPTNGNWGGKCWGGGRYSCGKDGPGNAPPVDSLDVCAKTHDMCWARCENDKECQSDSGISECNDNCDKEIASCLRNIDTVDPTNWPKPPPKDTENDSTKFQHGALFMGNNNFFRHK